MNHRSLLTLALVIAAVTTATAATPGDSGNERRPIAATGAAITDYAVEHHLSGLSPASLRPLSPAQGRTLDASAQQAQADRAAAAAYAIEHDLTGLSPASLRPADS
jgi:hypothetical protein